MATDCEIPIDSNLVLHTANGDLAGTLKFWNTGQHGTVVLIVPGSGPTDRDGNVPGMKSDNLKILAEQLSNGGIASVRIDKRGVGQSAKAIVNESSLTIDTYVSDICEWVKLLRKDKRFDKIVIIGHSEGALIGLLAAERDADALVSLAGAGESIDKILKRQLSGQPQAIRDSCYSIIDSLARGVVVPGVNSMYYSLFRPSVQPFLISWMKYDPQIEIKKIHVPVLILQGSSDLQVTVQDAQLLAAAKKDARLRIIDSMNHVLKMVKGDRQSNLEAYNDASLPVSPKLVSAITEFIRSL